MRLNYREMIIEVQQGLQRQNANVIDSQFAEEVIWALNMAQDEVVRRSMRQPQPGIPRFQISKESLTILQNIIETRTLRHEYEDGDVLKVQLPPLHRYSLSEG